MCIRDSINAEYGAPTHNARQVTVSTCCTAAMGGGKGKGGFQEQWSRYVEQQSGGKGKGKGRGKGGKGRKGKGKGKGDTVVEGDVLAGMVSSMQEQSRAAKPVKVKKFSTHAENCLLYTSPSPRDRTRSRMPSSA
eukprot:TRINITY_DN23508_c0_g1_i1.p2 TRINITY_DN23508_c0_g1~~TRINITY_DN23508_c0_g1_i1.p2  ORF type:complete len:135 (+),score=25.88 TRINITY_DN23508_c0_g1_i1:145-549(+)